MNDGAPWWWIRDEEARALGIGVGASRTEQGVVFGEPRARVRLEVVKRDAKAPLQLGPVSVRVWGASAEEPLVVRMLHRLGKTLHARRAMDFHPEGVSFASTESATAQGISLIDVPSVCQRACAFCAISQTSLDARVAHGHDDDVERQIAAAQGPVLFTGSDALAHPKIRAWIERACTRGPVSLVGPPRAEREVLQAQALAAAGLMRWSSAILGPDAASHDAIAGEAGSFDALRASCLAFAEAGVEVELITPLVRALLPALSAIAACAVSWTARAAVLQLYVPDPSVGTSMDALVPTWPELREALASLPLASASIEGVPPCLVPAQRRSHRVCLDRSEDSAVSYPTGPCQGCTLRAICPGIAGTSLRAVGEAGLGVLEL